MIGVFDSGIGGLAVLQKLKAAFPTADFCYFGDTENAPYGPRKESEIATLCAGSLRRLYALGARDIIVACNSATVALRANPPDLLKTGAFDVLDMLTPALATVKPYKHIIFFGTQATVSSPAYARAFKEHGIEAEGIALPRLAHLIEENGEREEMEGVIREGLRKRSLEAEAVLLACTHYPLVKEMFESVLAEQELKIPALDPSDAVRELTNLMFKTEGTGKLEIIFSKQTPAADRLVQKFFGKECSVEIKSSLYGTFNLNF